MHTSYEAGSRQSTIDAPQEGSFALPAAELRALAHRLVDDYCDSLGSLAREPVWQAMPEEVRARLAGGLPRLGLGLARAYEAFARDVRPYRYGNIHPRFFGWVNGSALPAGVLADFLASAMNSNVGGFDQSAVAVEEQVLAWLRELFEHPRDGDGILTSGGSLANLLGLAAARHAHAPEARERGLAGGPRLTLYGSVETHNSVDKAAELLGLGRASFRRLAVDAQHRLRMDALQAALAADRARGFTPFALVANAGTVNTGAIDPLAELGELARRERLWLHVDGAFGALAWLCPERRAELAGLPQADSLAFDLHKWGYLPFGVACLLVRDAEAHRAAFALTASYLTPGARGVIAGGLPFADRGLDLTRGFRALKVWFALKAHGVATLARLVEQNVEQARHLARLVEGHADLQLLAPVALNIVCFRYVAPGLDDAVLDALNEELLLRVQESGLAVPSSTVVRGRYALRVAATNHRSRRADFDLLVAAVRRHGAELLAERARPRDTA
jgi:glutamate/tyrosine decarboxylase-like PLP-dependent enzyme